MGWLGFVAPVHPPSWSRCRPTPNQILNYTYNLCKHIYGFICQHSCELLKTFETCGGQDPGSRDVTCLSIYLSMTFCTLSIYLSIHLSNPKRSRWRWGYWLPRKMPPGSWGNEASRNSDVSLAFFGCAKRFKAKQRYDMIWHMYEFCFFFFHKRWLWVVSCLSTNHDLVCSIWFNQILQVSEKTNCRPRPLLPGNKIARLRDWAKAIGDRNANLLDNMFGSLFHTVLFHNVSYCFYNNLNDPKRNVVYSHHHLFFVVQSIYNVQFIQPTEST